jgi:hypothetical protein
MRAVGDARDADQLGAVRAVAESTGAAAEFNTAAR